MILFPLFRTQRLHGHIVSLLTLQLPDFTNKILTLLASFIVESESAPPVRRSSPFTARPEREQATEPWSGLCGAGSAPGTEHRQPRRKMFQMLRLVGQLSEVLEVPASCLWLLLSSPSKEQEPGGLGSLDPRYSFRRLHRRAGK